MATQTQDERVAQTSLATKMLQRPELGALIGAAVIFFLFWSVDTTGNFAAVGGTAGWTDIAAPIGIIAVARRRFTRRPSVLVPSKLALRPVHATEHLAL